MTALHDCCGGTPEAVDGIAQFGLWFDGAFFPLIPAEELEVE